MVSLGKDGTISSQGQLSSVLAQDEALSSEFQTEKRIVEDDGDYQDQELDTKQALPAPRGKLIMDEEVSVGHIGWPARA